MDACVNPAIKSTAYRDRVIRSAALDDSTKARIYRQYLQGNSIEALAGQLGRSPSGVQQVVTEMRVRRVLELKIEAMPHASFDDPKLADEILAEMPKPADGNIPRRIKPPEGVPAYLASLYDVPLLTSEQEAHLFRKMNYLKYRALKLRDRIDPSTASEKLLDEIDWLMHEALTVKNWIIRANLRLVVAITKKRVGSSDNFFELVSDGNLSLIRAVEKFDFARGNKFSTYASWVITNNFIRSNPIRNHWRDRFVTGHDDLLAIAVDNRSDEHESERAQRQMRDAVKGMLGRLDDRERRIIVSRFGLDGAGEQTLCALGKELGVTKERVRQLEARAQSKLRAIATRERVDGKVVDWP
jgi:RNA polymerase primary sigma factor